MEQSMTLGDWLRKLAVQGSHMEGNKRSKVYRLTFLAAASVIWVPVIAFVLFFPERYYSEWSLVIPVSGSGHAVQLESLGQATQSELSPYANAIVDPRVNYKAIATSRPVLASAAGRIGIKVNSFGKPRIKLVDQTALMNFRIAAGTAEEALARAQALNDSLNQEIERLRVDELRRRESDSGKALASFSETLTDAQQKIVEFQAEAKIISLEQFSDLAVSIERSRKERDVLLAKRAGLINRIQALEDGLGVPQGMAGMVLILQNDAEFQSLLAGGAEAAATLAEYEARWGAQHFKVVAARANDQGMRKAVYERAAQVVRGNKSLVALIALANNSQARDLVQQLVQLSADLAGAEAEIDALDTQIVALKSRIEEGTSDAVTLEDLKRKQQVAMAVFTTALAKLDLGKTDSFSSYPMLQMLSAPTLPAEPDTLGVKLALVGGVLASLLCLAALTLLWIRKPYLQRILKSV